MGREVSTRKISVLKPVLTDKDVEKIILKNHTWFSGLLPPSTFKIIEIRDVYVPYILTGIRYSQEGDMRYRICYVFQNLHTGVKSGVIGIENLEFIEEETDDDFDDITINEEEYIEEVSSYCRLQLLARHHRKFIDWVIKIIELRVMWRKKCFVKYEVNGRINYKDIFVDTIVLK